MKKKKLLKIFKGGDPTKEAVEKFKSMIKTAKKVKFEIVPLYADGGHGYILAGWGLTNKAGDFVQFDGQYTASFETLNNWLEGTLLFG